jgi:hypothetical protein
LSIPISREFDQRKTKHCLRWLPRPRARQYSRARVRTCARMEGVHGSGGATSPTTSARSGTAGVSYKRKRNGAEFESSPGTGGEGEEDEEHKKRLPGVKRACNECRQQKVSHPQPWEEEDDCATGRRCSKHDTMWLMMWDHSCAATLFRTLLRDVRAATD